MENFKKSLKKLREKISSSFGKVPGGFVIGRLEVWKPISYNAPGKRNFRLEYTPCQCWILSLYFFGITWLSKDCSKVEDNECLFFGCGCTETPTDKWYNSKGHLFYVCPDHLGMLQSTVDDYEKVGPNEYRVIRSVSEQD